MMTLVEQLRGESHRALRARLVAGHPVDARALEGWAYRGTTLALPRAVERLTWTTFQKTFYRDPESGRLRGWNVRLEQDGLGAPSRPRLRHGVPVTTWHYEVVSPGQVPTPPGFDRGLIIDYGRGRNAALDTIRLTRDPLVALEPGSAERLLGVSYLALGRRCLETPTYFLLEREHRIAHVPALPRSAPLRDFERRWAELLFDALLGAGGAVPAMATVERATFWRCLGETTPPYFAPGLRAAVHALTFLPVTLAGFRRPFFALSPERRLACMEQLGRDPRLFVRQLLSTLKVVACLALFEDDGARRRFGEAQP